MITSTAEPPTLPSPGALVDGYVVEALIGRGAMAAVYSARGQHSGDRIALKMLLPQVATNRGVVTMLLDESRIAGCIDHENVARVFHTGSWCGTPYLQLELVDGWSYARVIKRARRAGVVLPRGFHAAVLAQVALGLSAAHDACDREGRSLAVVHRDVKPENVLVGFDGRAKLVDFGIARARTRSAATRPGCMKGTLGYMAPEQFTEPHSVSYRADLWALGAMAWEAFADRPLFRSRSAAEAMLAVVYSEIPQLRAVCAGLPDELCDLIRRCLSRDQSFRPDSAAEVADVLAVIAFSEGFADPERVGATVREIQAALVAAARPVERFVPARPAVVRTAARRRPWIAALAAGFVLSIAASASAAWVASSRPEMPAARRSVASWRVERPQIAGPTPEETIPVIDVSDLASEP